MHVPDEAFPGIYPVVPYDIATEAHALRYFSELYLVWVEREMQVVSEVRPAVTENIKQPLLICREDPEIIDETCIVLVY